MMDGEQSESDVFDFVQRLRQDSLQMQAEDWFDVTRVRSDSLEARPVERQDGREEGERIESDEWLIREPNGDTYIVDAETFDDFFETMSTTRTETVRIDLSRDTVETDAGFTVSGFEAVVECEATIDVRTDCVVSLDVQRVVTEDGEVDGGIPIELFDDHPNISIESDDE
jgi:hypothetical protein